MISDPWAIAGDRKVDLIPAEPGGEVCVPNEDQTPGEVTKQCEERDHGQPAPETRPHRVPPLTLGESAIYLNVTERYMRRLVAECRIPYLMVGRLLRFRVGDLDAYLESCLVSPVPRH